MSAREAIGELADAGGVDDARTGWDRNLTEFVIVVPLPEVATEFAVSEPVAGYLIPGYALAVAVGGVPLTSAITWFDGKRVLLG